MGSEDDITLTFSSLFNVSRMRCPWASLLTSKGISLTILSAAASTISTAPKFASASAMAFATLAKTPGLFKSSKRTVNLLLSGKFILSIFLQIDPRPKAGNIQIFAYMHIILKPTGMSRQSLLQCKMSLNRIHERF